jgi:hypothetical protein
MFFSFGRPKETKYLYLNTSYITTKISIMKNINYLLLTVIALVLWACNFSAGTNIDLSTGLSYNYNGFSVDEVLFVGPDNTVKNNNEVQLGTAVAIVVQGLANYELEDNKAYPGLMLSVTDKEGTFIVNEADIFAESEGYSAANAAILRGTFTIGNPMEVGETYHVLLRVWDKNKLENELTAEVDIVVK